jgi:hypothetical protein
MAYHIIEPDAGFFPIAAIDSGVINPGYVNIGTTTANPSPPAALGMIVKAKDPTYGVGEFICLKGVASTVVGSIVHYDAEYATALHTSALDHPRPLAIAMSANTAATTFGWYQISGLAIVTKANTLSLAVGDAIGASSGAAVVVATGSIINGAMVAAVASAVTASTTVEVMIDRPHDTSDVS